MKTTCRAVLTIALATYCPTLIWGTEAPSISSVSEPPPPAPSDVIDTPKSPDGRKKTATSSAAAEPASNPVIAAEDAMPAAATVEQTTETLPPAAPDDPSTYHSWIEKVRAQRRARMEEHREAMEARRYHYAPWEYRPFDSLELQREKMREARQNRSEWREQSKRAHRRWSSPHGELMKEAHDARRQLIEAEAETQRKQMDLLWQQQKAWIYGQMPHGWNNPWYYRGY